jgi:hypothetical protein
MKEAPKQAKGVGAFSFWGGFEARIQSTGSLPDPHLHFALGWPNERLRHLFALVYNNGKIHTFGALIH